MKRADFLQRARRRAKAGQDRIVTHQVSEFGRDGRPTEPDGRLDAPAFHRNHEPIWSVLGSFLNGKRGDVLEVGSGTGQHVVEFARRAPAITVRLEQLRGAAQQELRPLARHPVHQCAAHLAAPRVEVPAERRREAAPA